MVHVGNALEAQDLPGFIQSCLFDMEFPVNLVNSIMVQDNRLYAVQFSSFSSKFFTHSF